MEASSFVAAHQDERMTSCVEAAAEELCDVGVVGQSAQDVALVVESISRVLIHDRNAENLDRDLARVSLLRADEDGGARPLTYLADAALPQGCSASQ